MILDLSPYDVSRETQEKLSIYVELIEKWTPKINLISRSSQQEIWTRHIIDSLQTVRTAQIDKNLWVDLGSGGGLPGLVAAILRSDKGDDQSQTTVLVESDQRKCAFLRTVVRTLSLDAHIISGRIEQIDPLNADILSARALADLTTLLGFADRHLSPDGVAIFPKGVNWKKEHEDASRQWRFLHEVVQSDTQPGAVILKIKEISRV